jgi:hypothetical protein
MIEKKMKGRGIVAALVHVLDWDAPELLIVVLTFLKKLSIFRENKNEMAKAPTIQKLARFVPHDNEPVLNTVLRLLLNLSFDPELQGQITRAGLIPKLVGLLDNDTHRSTVLKVLYHLSMSEKGRAAFVDIDAVPVVLKYILETPPDQFINRELIALAINLCAHQPLAELMVQGEGLPLIMKRIFKTWDPLLMKMVRNISGHHGKIKDCFEPYLKELINMAMKCKNDDVLVEVLGTLANLAVPQFNW